jgi:integrase/recombinase XerD
MKQRFKHADEERLREQFIGSHPVRAIHPRRSNIRRACEGYREAFPGDSILNHTHSTEWVSAWRKQFEYLSPSTRIDLMWALFAWWKWLFEERIIDDNILDLVPCERIAVEDLPTLILGCNLQRLIADHIAQLDGVSARSRESYRVWLKRFNVFINRLPQEACFQGDRLCLTEATLISWFRHICSAYKRVTVLQATNVLSSFFDTLTRKDVLGDNPLERLRYAFPMGKRLGIAYALASDDPTTALESLARPPMFSSVHADYLTGFLELKRAVGCRYPHGPTVLRDFDRFLVDEGEGGTITSPLLARWHASRPELSAASHRGRWSVMRQFCLYLQRYHPETYIPDPLLGRYPIPRLKPHIIPPETMRKLIAGVPSVAPGSRFALRPKMYTTLLPLLYTTGLRISEALALRVVDVDFAKQLLVVRQSKFGKSRLVPFARGMGVALDKYHSARQDLLGVAADEDPFFITQYGEHYKKNSVGTVWQRLLRATQLGGGRGQGPRIHDLRHSFATLRLLAWYNDGEDIEARLPLLSTYLGHSSVWATQRYLTILPEIRQAASERFHTYGGSLISFEGGCHELT